MYSDILSAITFVKDRDFESASLVLENCVNSDPKFFEILTQIGVIPEWIPHDSTEEKLFSKVSDAVLSRAFREIGLKSTVLRGRSDSADVLAESPLFGYTLVADAKAFRLSRTAKNQKDFKIVALSGWRKDAEYAVLCSPYFQYPMRSSQIYAQAIEHNVCLLSWEHLVFLLEKGIKESALLDFSKLWGFCNTYSHKIFFSDAKKSFTIHFNNLMLELTNTSNSDFVSLLERQIAEISIRGEHEKNFWRNKIEEINQLSREEAIRELIKAQKIHEKMNQIDAYIGSLHI